VCDGDSLSVATGGRAMHVSGRVGIFDMVRGASTSVHCRLCEGFVRNRGRLLAACKASYRRVRADSQIPLRKIVREKNDND
jgi:hypothetical protein